MSAPDAYVGRKQGEGVVSYLLAQASAHRIPLRDESIQCVVTSPPYWALRSYAGEQAFVWGGATVRGDRTVAHEHEWGEEGRSGQRLRNGEGSNTAKQAVPVTLHPSTGAFCTCGAWYGSLGLEPTPELYVQHMVEVFREVRRVLRKDGTLWLNLGDSYAANGTTGGGSPVDTRTDGRQSYKGDKVRGREPEVRRARDIGLKPKNLVGIPWRVAFALQADGWYLRSDIVWCLSAATRVYARTQKGEQPMSIHDMVRLDPTTVQLWNGERWTQVLGWSKRESETLRLTLRSGERIIASPDHRWPLLDERLVETRVLKVGDVLVTARLPEPEQTDSIPADLAWFAGLYLAEGSHSDDAIQIAGHADEVERHERVFAIAERYGGTAVLHGGPGQGVNVVVHGGIIEGALRHYVAGRTALDKHVHPRAWRSPNANLRAFMEGYLAGDGHHDVANDRWRLGFGNNPQWADSLRTLASRLGAALTIAPTLVKMGRTRTFEAYRGEWRWQASGHGNAKQRAEIVAIDPRAATEVWDIGVEDDPHLFALASGVLTHNSKPNPMPESVTDRPTKSHEYLFLMSKSERYFYDADAIRETAEYGRRSNFRGGGAYVNQEATPDNDRKPSASSTTSGADPDAGRNARSVWSIATQPYPGAHFATFPEAIPERCIKAGSAAQACSECGAPWRRVTERTKEFHGGSGRAGRTADEVNASGKWEGQQYGRDIKLGPVLNVTTLGFTPTCAHAAPSVGSVVFDPFNGSGTTGRVALRLGRRYVGLDLSREYLGEQALRRIDPLAAAAQDVRTSGEGQGVMAL